MKRSRKLLAAGLAASLLLSVGAYAAPDTEKRQADLDSLYTGLKDGHPDLFANTPEADFLTKIAEIEGRMDTRSDFDFSLDLQSFAAMVGDSHTNVNIGGAGHDLFPVSMDVYEGKWVLSVLPKAESAWLGSEVVTVNGLSVDALVDKFRPIVSYDNDIKLARQVKQMWYVEEILNYLGVVEPGKPLVLAVKNADGKTGELKLTALTNDEETAAEFARLKDTRKAVPATELDRQKYYFALPLDESTYYIQYNRCQQDPENPMEAFAKTVETDLSGGKYNKVILDLRGNGGGSDGAIVPVFAVLAPMVWSGDIKLFGLTGEQTFSSAGINASMVQEMGGFTVGSPTGGCVDHFGAVNGFTLPNSGLKVGHSTKFIDMETLLITAAGLNVEPLKPDVAVEQTLSDYLAGKDTAVDYLLANGDSLAVPVRANVETTRAGFVAKLWREAGSPAAQQENKFPDIRIFFGYYIPALNWATEKGIILGDDQGNFRPTDAVTEAEKALITDRLNAISAAEAA